LPAVVWVFQTAVVNGVQLQPDLCSEYTLANRTRIQSGVSGCLASLQESSDQFADSKASPATANDLVLRTGRADCGSPFCFFLTHELTSLVDQRGHKPFQVIQSN